MEVLVLASLTLYAPPPTLSPTLYKPLPLGSYRASGWLLGQLTQQANTLSGHLNLFWADVQDSVWVGGKSDKSGAGHERGPYWLNGLVPLVAILNASKPTGLNVHVAKQVDEWIVYILDHQNATTGWLGPDDGLGGKGDDYWSAWNVVAALLQYADAKRGTPIAARCMDSVLAHIAEASRRMKTTPLKDGGWSQNRWQDWVYLCEWTTDMGVTEAQRRMLYEASQLAFGQRWDWQRYYAQDSTFAHQFPEKNVPDWTMYDHGVNNAMGLKWGAVAYRLTGDPTYLAEIDKMLAMQDRYQGQPYGMFSADEVFGGRALNRGIELCAVVEQMYSLEVAFRVGAELPSAVSWLDRLEMLAFNALPATISADMWQHQYLQQANEITACVTDPHVWQQDGPDSTLFGVEPNFGCCTANFNQGWPKYAASALLTRVSDGALLVALPVPIAATLADGTVVTVDTEYPLEDTVRVSVTVPARRTAPLPVLLRVPSWAVNAVLSVDGGDNKTVANGTLVSTKCLAGWTTQLTLYLRPEIRVETGWGVKADHLANGHIDANGYSRWSGALPAGGDLHSGNYSVLEATLWCNATSACVGFTMQSDGPTAMVEEQGEAAEDEDEDEDDADAATHKLLDEHRHQHRHLHRHGTRGKARAGPPPSPPEGGAVPGSSLVYFKRHFGANGDARWASYAKAWAGRDTNAAAVRRGPLLFALQLEQTATVVKTWEPFHNTDLAFTTPSVWNYALRVDPTAPVTPLVFERITSQTNVPFNSSAPNMRIRALATTLNLWNESLLAADEPPPSPVQLGAAEASSTEEVILIPYGATELRMGAMPWAMP